MTLTSFCAALVDLHLYICMANLEENQPPNPEQKRIPLKLKGKDGEAAFCFPKLIMAM